MVSGIWYIAQAQSLIRLLSVICYLYMRTCHYRKTRAERVASSFFSFPFQGASQPPKMKVLLVALLALAVVPAASSFEPSSPSPLLPSARFAAFPASPLLPAKRKTALPLSVLSSRSPPTSSTSSSSPLRGGACSSNSAPSVNSNNARFAPPAVDRGSSSVSSSVFNLVNNVAGAGILTLPAGMARGTGVVPSLLICICLGVLSSHSFNLIGESCRLTGARDFKTLWERSLSPSSSWIVDAVIATMCLACSVIYAGILGDVFSPFLSGLSGIPASLVGRGPCILAITASVLFPLSLLKDLSALAFTSILGFASVVYTVVFLVVRALDGSYAGAAARFLADKKVLPPNFSTHSMGNVDFTSLVLASNLGLAYIAHYNAPAYYRDMSDRRQFSRMVSYSFAILTALYAVTMLAGYYTFGAACAGNVLLNYHPDDKLALLGRLATGFSILFGFPLAFIGLSSSLLGILSKNKAVSGFVNSGVGRPLFMATLLAMVSSVAVAVPDIGAVVGITGALMGSLIVYIIPAILYARSVGLVKGWDSKEYAKAKLNNAMVPFGTLIAVMGVWMTLKG